MPDSESTDPGCWAEDQPAVAVIAGHCSAARAQCIKTARDSRAFEALGLTWDEYAERHFGIRGGKANQLIRHLERFGENYFHISEFARIGPAAYRRLVNRVNDGRLHFEAKQLGIAPENVPRIRAVIESLRAEWRQAQPGRPEHAALDAAGVPDSLPVAEPDRGDSDPTADAAAVLDDWHQAASVADEGRFFSHFTADAIMLGAEPSERYTVSQFRAATEARFEESSLWIHTPRDRSIGFSADRAVAWFDELLDPPWHCLYRGCGVLVRQKASWKIAQYQFATRLPDPLLPENLRHGTSSRVK